MKRFDSEHLFLDAVKDGLTLFCGAGFSVLACDKTGKALPAGNALLEELKEEFNSIKEYNQLSLACTKLKRGEKELFYDFLEERFRVNTFDPLYSVLQKINIKSIYTTNIDDLFYKIYEDALQQIHDRTKGDDLKTADLKNELMIDYFPLHGSVVNGEPYLFGSTEIASAFSSFGNHESWLRLSKDSSQNPILFWGWNFEDSGPIEAMYGGSTTIDDNIKKWALLYNPIAQTVNVLEALGFNIIISDTQEMLTYLSEQESHFRTAYNTNIDIKSKQQLEKYQIPQNNAKLAQHSINSFFSEYAPHWSHIYSGKIPKTKHFTKISDAISSKKDVIIIGMRYAGKTTLLMQLCIDYKTERNVHYMTSPSLEEVRSYLKLVKKSNTLLYVDDCFRDTDAVIELLNAKNVQVILCDRDFNYERQYHRLENYCDKFTMIDITEIYKEDAQKILDVVPYDLRKSKASTKNFELDPTLPSLLSSILKPQNFKFINRFYDQDKEAARVFIMVCYVHSCGVPCSFDMIYSFLGDDEYTWRDMYEIIDRVGGLIKELSDTDDEWNFRSYIQDYYLCRTPHFAEKIIFGISPSSAEFRDVLITFTQNVPQYKICHYDEFRRNAYDAKLITKAFGDNISDGKKFYENCILKDDSEYIYQQAALYFSDHQEYQLAFYWIDKARSISHYNRFSIDSTYAKIFFDANIESASKPQLVEALNILKKCCTNDKRRSIHFCDFGKRALLFHEKCNNDASVSFLKDALEFIEEGISSDNQAIGHKNIQRLQAIKNKILFILH